jgi:hypothetical protein
MTSTNYTSISYLEETTPGTIETVGSFQILPTTGGAPTGNLTTATSEVIRRDRMTDDLIVVDSDVNGSMNFEMSYAPYKPILTSLMRNTSNDTDLTGTDVAADNTGSQFTSSTTDFSNIKVGEYVLVSGFTDTTINTVYKVTSVAASALGVTPAPAVDEAAGNSVGVKGSNIRNGASVSETYSFLKLIEGITNPAYFYYSGCIVNKASLNFEMAAVLKGTFDIVGREETVTETAINVNALTDVPSYDLMNSVSSITDIDIQGLSSSTCFQKMDLTIDNKSEAAKCIGTLGAKGHSDFSLEVKGSIDLYFDDIVAYSKYKNSESFSVAVVLKDASNNYLIVYMPKCKFEELDPPIDGKDSFLMLSGSFIALRDSATNMMIQMTFIPGA